MYVRTSSVQALRAVCVVKWSSCQAMPDAQVLESKHIKA